MTAGYQIFDFERAIVKRRFAGGLVEVQDVDLIGMHQIDRPHSHGIAAAHGQLRRVSSRDAVRLLRDRYARNRNQKRH